MTANAATTDRSALWTLADEARSNLDQATERLRAIEFMIGYAFAEREPDELSGAITTALFEMDGFIHTAVIRAEETAEALSVRAA